jgi:hypothetical protein
MTEGTKDNSGELSSFLHLTGWRPLVLALFAGLAGAVGLFGALDAPSEFQARYVLNANRVADDDLQPAELDIFVEEIAQTAKFPAVAIAVEERTGLVIEDDYVITVNQSGSSVATVDINVVSELATDAQDVAIETGIEALTITLTKTLGGLESGSAQIENALSDADGRVVVLTVDSGGINPTVAYDLAAKAVLDRRAFLLNRPTEVVFDEDGNPNTQLVPEPEPALVVLEAEASRLEPIDREYRQVAAEIDALNLRLADRRSSIRDANAALLDVAVEREQELIISEVVTEETSRIAGLLSGLLLFAVPVALLMILFFTIWDFFRKKPDEEPLRRADDIDSSGILEAQGHRALPEASFMPLVVVDEDELERDVLADEDADDIDNEHDERDIDDEHDIDDEDEETSTKKRSKDGRWGRDASSKAG